jgi:Asp-tRNA(Asn)/Glu-tRNA(Gln) amidotransferase A subunit family amidase
MYVGIPKHPVGAHTVVDKPEEVEGAPGHIQIMGKAMRDEELMEVMKAVEDLLRSNA